MIKDELVFNLYAALKCGKCWTRQGYVVKLYGVSCGPEHDYVIRGYVYGRFPFREKMDWTLDGKFCHGKTSALDLITNEPLV